MMRPSRRTGRWLGLALPLLILTSLPAKAALMSAQDLVTACSGDQTAKAACNGYLMAVTDALLLRESRGRSSRRVCLPETVSVDQVRDAVLGVAQRPRAEHAASGVMVVMMALRRTFPCQEESKPQ
jgi:hypothetical protein